jgi:hypothetical protein
MLRPGNDGSAEDWHLFFHRWTRIAKDIGGLPHRGERLRVLHHRWLNRHPPGKVLAAAWETPERSISSIKPVQSSKARCH